MPPCDQIRHLGLMAICETTFGSLVEYDPLGICNIPQKLLIGCSKTRNQITADIEFLNILFLGCVPERPHFLLHIFLRQNSVRATSSLRCLPLRFCQVETASIEAAGIGTLFGTKE